MPQRLLHQTWTIRTISPFTTAWNLEDLRKEELIATSFVRGFVSSRGRVERDGTYITIEWIHINDGSDNEHLHMEIHIADSPTAQLVLCYPTCQQDEETNAKIISYEYALVHGDRKCYEILLSYLENNLGCVIGGKSFRPSSADITRILLDTVHGVDKGEGQLEVTFGTPRSITKISNMTISFPPTSLARLLLELEKTKPSDQDEIHVASMLVKALRAFISDVFCIDVKSFPIIRVANSTLIIGATGRIKFTKKDNLRVLGTIKTMVRERVKARKTPKRKRMDTYAKESSGGEFEGDESSENDLEDDDEGGDDERKPDSVVDEGDKEQKPSENAGSTVPVGLHLDGELEDKEMIAI